MKKSKLLVIALTATALTLGSAALAGCSKPWQSSAEGHWRAEDKSDIANHVDEDHNGYCDICNFEIPKTPDPEPGDNDDDDDDKKDDDVDDDDDDDNDDGNDDNDDGDDEGDDEIVRAFTIAVGGELTIPTLDTTGVTLTLEDMDWDTPYTLSCENDKVSFIVGIEQGNPVSFEYSMMLRSANVVSTEGTLTNVVIKFAEGEVEEVEYYEIELDESVTVTGDVSWLNPATYQIELGAGEYQILIDDQAVTNNMNADVQLGYSLYDGCIDYFVSEDSDVLTVSAAGTYYVQAISNVTFKIVSYVHVHTIDETRWESDVNGHWHPLTCIHRLTEKGDVLAHEYTSSAPDDYGIVVKTCATCGYVFTDLSNMNATVATRGSSLSADGGVYKTTITAMSDWGGYYPRANSFSITCGDTAKTYTIEILSNNTAITDTDAYETIEEVGDKYVVVVGAGQKLRFSVTTGDYTCDENYSVDVAFKITVSDAPDEGDISMPATAAEGTNTKSVEANQKVYYKISSAVFSGDLEIKFDSGVTVESLGYKVDNEGTALASGYVIKGSSYEWYPVYICVSSASGEISFEIEKVVEASGAKSNPAVATFGAENSNQVALDTANNVYDRWFKLEAAEDGTYVIKAIGEASAYFEIFNSTSDWSSTAYGSLLVLNLQAGVPVYVKATENYGKAFAFTVTEATDADRGYSASFAKEITESGDYTIVDGANTTYFTFTATEDCTLEFVYNNGEESTSNRLVLSGSVTNFAGQMVKVNSTSENKATVELKGGKTYALSISKGSGATSNTFSITISPKTAEDEAE